MNEVRLKLDIHLDLGINGEPHPVTLDLTGGAWGDDVPPAPELVAMVRAALDHRHYEVLIEQPARWLPVPDGTNTEQDPTTT